MGQTDEILQPRISRRRRKWPREAAYAELHALIWIRYQKASGSMTEQAARGAVAEAFGVGERAPEKWRAGAEKDLGVEYVAESLDEAEAEGALAAAGKPISRASQLASVLQTGLPAIAKTWKWAREPK